MYTNTLRLLAGLSWLAAAPLARADDDAEVHGEGDEGTIMGPVAFLWPDDRPWSATYDNIGPCGSSSGVSNRTIYPLTQGEVALSIADDAWNVAFYMAFDSDPETQSDFTEQVVSNITRIEAGHQCYKIASIPSSVTAGTNATIQLEYWSDYAGENNGKNETFYACADITFVEAADFTLSVPCFNVTAEDFVGGVETTTVSPSATATSTTSPSTSSSSSSSSDGLSTGAKAGIAVGVIVASLAIVGAFAFAFLRKRKSQQASVLPQTSEVRKDTASIASGTRE
ncbi:hypothetical protein BKA67DRAFT_588877 [Truncatella angustata]|uniref:Copper acquisition factor BIM1-like domain-containing protein n=1 Tax=Truncatella angustata TaxID=152316 RepID=A0A9P8RHB2_9PEZI|nr:uncharacterized protein BKA67DRAFT_588877 [Truncatella angustata]KAH6638580.1 hypothetical protein BKA67DRAFT_588877 [Truncatella angustata]